jgi:hypothetical protein
MTSTAYQRGIASAKQYAGETVRPYENPVNDSQRGWNAELAQRTEITWTVKTVTEYKAHVALPEGMSPDSDLSSLTETALPALEPWSTRSSTVTDRYITGVSRRETPQGLHTWTVLGFWYSDEPVVIGIVAGEHDVTGGTTDELDDSSFQGEWATSVTAATAEEAQEAAVREMLDNG